jgi:hypothetical protein
MNVVRKTATTLGGIFFAVLLISALAPKAAHGVAAALVQVTNTASNAVPTEDGPGNFPFGGTLCTEILNSDCGSALSGLLVPTTTSTAAAVKRLVIEDVSAFCSMEQGDVISPLIRVPLPADNVMAGQNFLVYSFPITAVGGPTGSVFGVTHSPVRIYADPGAEIETQISGFFAGTHGASCNIYLTGHLEPK